MRLRPCLAVLLSLPGSFACGAHISTVEADTLQLRYARPTPSVVAATPLAVVYDPRELPDEVPLAVPGGFPKSTVRQARSLVTQHLRAALETVFERVYVVDDPALAPPGAAIATVHFLEVGITVAGTLPVGLLEWSVDLRRPGEPRPFYSWAERVVGTRGGYGQSGRMDASPLVQGAIEASLRALLNDVQARGVVRQVDAPAARPSGG
jgi:hypothetical protein